jgi:hypothetical protein
MSYSRFCRACDSLYILKSQSYFILIDRCDLILSSLFITRNVHRAEKQKSKKWNLDVTGVAS